MMLRALYCILFLHQTTTVEGLLSISCSCIASSFYIKPQPAMRGCPAMRSCIASSFYIKPQLLETAKARAAVVLHPLSTSNHNFRLLPIDTMSVVLHPLSTSNHNHRPLHPAGRNVVLHPLSTSNHNDTGTHTGIAVVVLHPLSTSNHNASIRNSQSSTVVLHPLSTSNHNRTPTSPQKSTGCIASSFYIKPQRLGRVDYELRSCIASSFYIKPQLGESLFGFDKVVLHPLSTSNHNKRRRQGICKKVVLHPLSTSNHNPRTPDTLIFGHLTASRHDTKRGGVHRGSRFDAVFTFSTNIRKIIFTEIRRCMSVQRAGARLRSDSSEANI